MLLPSLVLVASFAAASPASPADAKPVAVLRGVTEYRLDNGLRILVVPDPSSGTFTLISAFLAGWVDDPIGGKGVAHLVEHVSAMRTGSHPNLPDETARYGDFCSWTATEYEHVQFCTTLPFSSENLKWALDVEADRITNPLYTREGMQLEFAAMKQEEQLVRNDRMEWLSRQAFGATFSSHVYRQYAVLEELQNITPEMLHAYHAAVYRPDNNVIVLAGPVIPEEGRDAVARAYARVKDPAHPRYIRSTGSQPAQTGERRIEEQRAGTNHSVLFMFRAPPPSHRDYAALEVLAGLLQGTTHGALERGPRLSGLDASVSVSLAALSQASVFQVYAQAPASHSVKALESALDSSLAAFPTTVTKSAIVEAQGQLAGAAAQEFNDSRTLAFELVRWQARGDWRRKFWNEAAVQKVTKQDIVRVARTYLKRSKRTTAILAAASSVSDPAVSNELAPELPDFAFAAVEPGERFNWSPASLQHRTTRGRLEGGLQFGLVPVQMRSGSSTVSISLHANHLPGVDPTELLLAGKMLLRGTTRMDRTALEARLHEVKASASVTPIAGGFLLTLQSSGGTTNELLDLAAELIRSPAFDPREFAHVKTGAMGAAAWAASDVVEVARGECLSRLFPQHPDGRPFVQTIEHQARSIRKTTVGTARRAYKSLLAQAAGEVVVIGSFNAKEVRAKLESRLGTLQVKAAESLVVANTENVQRGEVTLPGTSVAALCAATRLDPVSAESRYPAQQLGATLLATAESAVSRLGKRLRFNDQLSYIVVGRLEEWPLRPNPVLQVVATFDPTSRENVNRALADELAKAAGDGFTAEELDLGRRLWISRRLTQLSTPTRLASIIASQLVRGTDFKEEQAIAARIQSLTSQEVVSALDTALAAERSGPSQQGAEGAL